MNSVDSQQINYTMNIIWTAIVIISIIMLTIINADSVLSVAIAGITDAVNTTVTLCAVYCFWGGILAIMQDSKLTQSIASLFEGVVKKLFGVHIPDEAISSIAINMSANILGVSNASTPSAIASIEILEKDNTTLSRAGAMLFVINASSIQLLPTTVMGMRASLNSISPTDIVLPTLISTIVTTLLGVLLVNVAYRKKS